VYTVVTVQYPRVPERDLVFLAARPSPEPYSTLGVKGRGKRGKFWDPGIQEESKISIPNLDSCPFGCYASGHGLVVMSF